MSGNVAHVLLLEDDPALGRGLKISLEVEGYRVSWATSIKDAVAKNAEGPIDLFLIDWNLPDGNGLDFCKEVRTKGKNVPIIFLTAKVDEDSAIQALTEGANDFVRKPFNQRELFARIKAFLRESITREEQLRFGQLLVLVRSRKAFFGKSEITLNRREFDILLHLVKNAEATVSRDELLRVIEKEGEIYDRTVDSHLSHLRARLKSAQVGGIQISSVYGVGYKLEKVAP